MLLGSSWSAFVQRLIYLLPAIVIALTFHEYAHAAVSYRFGDPTAKNAGRLTLNPLRHLDLFGTLLLFVAGFGWAKPVPVNPFFYQGNRRMKMLAVAAAGPLMNVLEALVGAALLSVLYHFAPVNAVFDYFWYFLIYYVQINAVLAVFNLIPIPPLDGSKILGSLLPVGAERVMLALERWGFAILLLLVFLPNILSWFDMPQLDILDFLISRPATWLCNLFYHIVGIY